MARKGIQVKEGEDHSPATIKRVIKLLADEKPITKKAACDILKIAYNTKRLGAIIDKYIEDKEFAKLRRKQVSKLPITKADVKDVCSMYLSGEPLTAIVENTFRSSSVVKRLLLQHNIPLRNANNNYQNPVYLDDDTWAEDYKKGDLVYSARYGSAAIIEGNGKFTEEHGMVYPIHISGEYERSAYQPSYELADLRNLQKEFGVEALFMSKDDSINQINITMSKAKKNRAKYGEF
jgi:hypothetical protein